jgi:hypothetical protein
VVFVGTAGADHATAQVADRDCKDFSTQAGAKRHYASLGGPSRDPDRLDGDADGVACEARPCPCTSAGVSEPRPEATPDSRAEGISARITSVVDGDRIKVRARRRYTVRLIRIDTPENVGPVRRLSAAALRRRRA